MTTHIKSYKGKVKGISLDLINVVKLNVVYLNIDY